MKKIIALPAGRWARELLTLSGAERIDYFLDDDPDKIRDGFPIGTCVKPVYPLAHLLTENKEDIIAVITDSQKYKAYKDLLTSYGLTENIHFFDGWHLGLDFYRFYGDDTKTWKQYEESISTFDFSEYEPRVKKMASVIPDDITSIMDMGCGTESLRKYIRSDIHYYGLDSIFRNANTIVCDVNHEELPAIRVDAYFMSGFLLYVNDVELLFSQMRRAKYLIFDLLSYSEYMKFGNIYMNIYTRQSKSITWNERDHLLKLSEVIEALFHNQFTIVKALELDRNGRDIAYVAENSARLLF